MIKYVLSAALFIFAQASLALTIHAKLDSFQGAGVSYNGGSPGGGIGSFTVTGGDVWDYLNGAPSFEAVCLEPLEFVTVGQTYIFSVVPLAASPTNPGPMGAVKATSFLEIMELGGHSRIEDITGAQEIGVAQMAAWEASQELVANPFNIAAGATTVSYSVPGDADIMAKTALLDGVTGLEGFGLLNVGQLGGIAPLTKYRGQDFAVFNEVEAPGTLALFGLGLLGLAGIQKRFENKREA